MKEFTSNDVIDLYTRLLDQGIQIWIDGGWAVDALLGTQTRPHSDLDIAIEKIHLTKAITYLESQGYKEVDKDEDKKWDNVLADESGHEIEIHSFAFDENKNFIEEPYWNGYSRNSLTGIGLIGNLPVKCVSLEQLIKTHNPEKRKFKETDYKDMDALQKKFGIIR